MFWTLSQFSSRPTPHQGGLPFRGAEDSTVNSSAAISAPSAPSFTCIALSSEESAPSPGPRKKRFTPLSNLLDGPQSCLTAVLLDSACGTSSPSWPGRPNCAPASLNKAATPSFTVPATPPLEDNPQSGVSRPLLLVQMISTPSSFDALYLEERAERHVTPSRRKPYVLVRRKSWMKRVKEDVDLTELSPFNASWHVSRRR